MSETRKYLGLGFAIGASITGLMMGVILFLGPSGARIPFPAATTPPVAASPTHEASARKPTPSPVATFTPTPTSLSQPTVAPAIGVEPGPTSDPVLAAVNGGDLVFSGPLSNAQQINLYRASLAYAETSVQDSKRMAKEINGVGYGDPTNICGPLAIAILRDAGLIGADIVPHDFWLLNPANVTDQRQLARAFPREDYTHTKVGTPLNKVDWRATPLEPGDFLFIWHGSGGNFDHMLVVNRVDSELRAYAVTNFGTPSGFILAETLLYDPHDAHAGIFHTWTKEHDAILGSTGFGGYEVWRLRGPS
jgi:hypothetical protein